MGVSFSGGLSTSYRGFNEFRQLVACALGLPDPACFWVGLDDDDPLVALMDHSDCDGKLSVAECHGIAARLREVLPLAVGALPDIDDAHPTLVFGYRFAELLANAESAVEFR